MTNQPSVATIEPLHQSQASPAASDNDQVKRTHRSAGQKPQILAITNQKGGVGKTTTAINLGTALAAAGRRVLIIDCDAQGNASTGLGIDRKRRRVTTYDVLIGRASIADAEQKTTIPTLTIVPATVDLSAVEIELISDQERNYKLHRAIAACATEYDFILLDCPPSLGLLTLNALCAATSVLVPLQAEFFALEGLSMLLRTIERVKRTLNPDLQLRGIVLTMFDRRNNLSLQVESDVRSFLGERVFETVIPRNVRVSEAPSFGKPVLLYDLKCTGSSAYAMLAREMLRQDRELRKVA